MRTEFLLLCFAVAFLGCSSKPENPPTFKVTGKVTYQGKPVENATVVLVAQDSGGRGAAGNSAADGTFSLGTFGNGDGAVPGSYKVKVFKYEMTAEPPNDGDDPMTEEEEQESYNGVEEESSKEGGNLLPARYENPDKSGFSITVLDQPVTLDLDLK